MAWEVDEHDVRKTVGDRTTTILLTHVARVSVTTPVGSRKPIFQAADSDGKTTIDIQTGTGVSLEDVRAFYEAAACYLQGYPAIVTNPSGWQPVPPSVPERKAAGSWFEPRDFLGHLAYMLITGGLPLLAGAGLGKPWLTIAGIGFIAAGIAVVLKSRQIRKAPSR